MHLSFLLKWLHSAYALYLLPFSWSLKMHDKIIKLLNFLFLALKIQLRDLVIASGSYNSVHVARLGRLSVVSCHSGAQPSGYFKHYAKNICLLLSF